MKKINKFIFLLLLVILPSLIYADEIEYSLVCDNGPFNYGQKFQCNVISNKKTEINYDEMSGELTAENGNVTCSLSNVDSGLSNSSTSQTGFKLSGKAETTTYATYSCEVTKKSTSALTENITINNFIAHAKNSGKDPDVLILRNKTININPTEENVKETDPRANMRDTSNAKSRIKSITSDDFDFTFSSFKTNYDIQVLFEVESVTLNIAPNVDGETIKIDNQNAVGNTINLDIGDNVIDIYATSPDGSSTTCYTLNIKRLTRGEQIYYIEKDASLSSLSIEGFNIDFEPTIYEYNIHLTVDQSSVNVKAIPTDENAKCVVSNQTDLVDGSVISIVVTSEDGSTTNTYYIHVTKDAPKKDYTSLIFGILIVVAIIIVILIIVRTNQKNKQDPILALKYRNKKASNKGNSLNLNDVPSVDTNKNNNAPDVIKLDNSNVAKPIVADDVLDSNYNNAVSTANSINLNNVTPVNIQTPVTPQEVQTPVNMQTPVNQENTPTPSAPLTPTNNQTNTPNVLNLSNAQVISQDVNNNQNNTNNQ